MLKNRTETDKIIKFISEYGADVNYSNIKQISALMVAIRYKNEYFILIFYIFLLLLTLFVQVLDSLRFEKRRIPNAKKLFLLFLNRIFGHCSWYYLVIITIGNKLFSI